MSTTTVLDRFHLDGKVAIVTRASRARCRFGQGTGRSRCRLVLAARRADRSSTPARWSRARPAAALTVTPTWRDPRTHKRWSKRPWRVRACDVSSTTPAGTAVHR